MKRLVVDIEEDMYEHLDILSGGIRNLRDKIVLDLIQSELEKHKHVIERLKDAEKRKQKELEMLREHYAKESDNDKNNNKGELNEF
ncbi:hypothetical protein HN695_00140 [Candidatus Woesearchaeota archaeon]|mgnify:CR=1 FL=1|nr:hypothetical protein [Candidatus Woesearchaeota archaeon]MBT5272873.1 hypothetical protein [Candidatus Woesearchaeota archaeon]MBT6041339.1 hypothetical protein [Candidatus Woesearchaeota archaeon]MBT6336419.1 hypothetical protein [Candidatus Woesearchaeota archaeon]MBT7926722.1 hypothetical protein [Candidatus Woesearchaeota archaeon]